MAENSEDKFVEDFFEDSIDDSSGNGGYLGNPLLKKVGEKIEWTYEKMVEYQKCAADPIYFAEKYMKIVHVDHGLIPIRLYDYQKEIINAITFNRRVVANTSRQAGKCFHINTIVKVRNKKTGQIQDMKIGDLYDSQKQKNKFTKCYKNTKLPVFD